MKHRVIAAATAVLLLIGIGATRQADAASSWKTRGYVMTTQSAQDGASVGWTEGYIYDAAKDIRVAVKWSDYSANAGTRVEGSIDIYCEGPNYASYYATRSFSRWVGNNQTLVLKQWNGVDKWTECEVSVIFDTYAGPNHKATVKAWVQQRN